MAIKKLERNSTKKIVQDILPSERRAIRKIIVDTPDEEIPKVTARPKKVVHIEKDNQNNNGSYKYLISFIIIFISIAVIGIALSLSYSKAMITVTSKVVNVDVNGTYTAKKSTNNNIAVDSDNEDIGYDTVMVSDALTQTIPAVKGPLIQTKARGSVVIYNNYSASPQILVAGTRLSSPNGLIYRTSTTVNVPGKKTTAGSISVAVVADQPGNNYNISITELKGEFKIPGYKGTDKYTGFSAKIKTSIVGGFYGNKMVINADTKKEKIKLMQDLLKEQLLTKLRTQSVPSEYILYDTAYNVEYTSIEPVMKDDSTAEITVKGSAYGAIFNSSSLIKYIAGKEIRKFPSDEYTVEGDKKLEFKISNIKDFSIKKETPLIFTLKGQVVVTGVFDEKKLKNDLIGVKLQDSNLVFAKYPSISSVHTLITPFWMRSFPNSAEKIKMEYKH